MMIIIFKQSKLNGRNNMAWVAVNKDGSENIFTNKPNRSAAYWYDFISPNRVILPKGSIKKLIGRDLDWYDEPVELKEE